MKNYLKNIVGCLFFLLAFIFVQAQEPPFWQEIQDFKKKDSISMPPQKAILFVGSSSFRLWKDLQADFPGYTIINRGFGGSSLPDVIRYAADIIYPYHPKQIVLYCGENDLAASDTITAQMVFERFEQLFGIIRAKFRHIPFVYVAIKPSPSRDKIMPAVLEANLLIKNFLKTKKRAEFADVYYPMLTVDGKPKPELFIDDKLHMNRDGYKIWQQVIEPFLLK